MSEYDDDFDSLDADVLAEMDAFEAKVASRNENPNTTYFPVTKRVEDTSKNAPNKKEIIDVDDMFDDLTIDLEDMNSLEVAASSRAAARATSTTKPAYNHSKVTYSTGSAVAGPSNSRLQKHNSSTVTGTTSGSLQTNLHGEILYPSSPPIQQPKHTGKRPAFGQRIRKSKVWDQTAFAKSGWKSTKAPADKKTKAKKPNGEEDGDELDVDLGDLPAPFMPHYRWFPGGKIIFVAPTKPLVAQQIEACHETCGIPGTEAIELTGQIPRETRAVHWQTKRVFYMTPQTLVNDLATGIGDPKKIVLLVVDEAHKGTGDYAYAQVVRFLMATNPFFRLLALTATPGSKPEVVQAIVDSLHISHIEIRNEESMDVRKYMHQKTITQHLVDLNEDVSRIREHLLKLITSVMKPLASNGIIYFSTASNVKDFVCTQALLRLGPAQKWAFKPLSTLASLARILGYLSEFSVGMAYHALQDLGQGIKKNPKKQKTEQGPNKIIQDPNFIAIIQEIERQRNVLGHFPIHPKMEKLRALAIQHFASAELAEEEKARPGQSAKQSDTKMIVYCTYRECVDEIVETLNEQQPMIRAHRFIGQGTDKRGAKGVSQKEQIAVINDFKGGKYNVIVATSIGEEGLDIGEVESIVCYDTSKAAIRTVQRAGRTGRKKAGKVEVLLTKGREDNNWEKATDAYKQVQQSIVQGIDLELYGDVHRLLPDGVEPQCVEKTMECIPYEREEAKSRGNSFSSRRTSTKSDVNGATKVSRKRARKVEDELDEVSEGDGEPSIPSPKRKKRFIKSDSEDEKMSKKKKTSTKVDRGVPGPSSSKLLAVPTTGFISARLMTAKSALDAGSDEEKEEDDPLLEKIFARRLEKMANGNRASSAKAEGKGTKGNGKEKERNSDRPSVERETPQWKPPAKQRTEKMAWLLESDSDSQHEKKKSKPDIKPQEKAAVIDLDTSSEEEGEQQQQQRTTDVRARFHSPPLSKEPTLLQSPPPPSVKPAILPGTSSPDTFFPPRRLARRPAAVIPSYDDSLERSPAAPRRLKRKGEQEDRDLMPPPPPRLTHQAGSSSNGSSSRPSAQLPSTGTKETRPLKYSILDRNDLLEVEAIHSGDEVDAGGSDSEGVANSSDIDFLVDTSTMSQVPDGYDQSAVYRQGLLTQVPE
ncbi:3'-5' DNA helicase, partial [Serendipita sp. 399]